MLPLHLHIPTHKNDSQTLANLLSTRIITETPSLALLDTPAYIYTTFTRTLKSICGYTHTHTLRTNLKCHILLLWQQKPSNCLGKYKDTWRQKPRSNSVEGGPCDYENGTQNGGPSFLLLGEHQWCQMRPPHTSCGILKTYIYLRLHLLSPRLIGCGLFSGCGHSPPVLLISCFPTSTQTLYFQTLSPSWLLPFR